MAWYAKSNTELHGLQRHKFILLLIRFLDTLVEGKQQFGGGTPTIHGGDNGDETPTSLAKFVAFLLKTVGKPDRLVVTAYMQSCWRENAGLVGVTHA